MLGLRAIFVATLSLAPLAAEAQVGHDPRSSPYRDLRHSSLLVPQAILFQGGGGSLGIVPNSGMLFGARAVIGGRGPLSLGGEFSTGTLERLIVDADDSVATRVKGPVDQRVTMVGLTLQLNLTGGKTWHGLAPYIGGSSGIAFAGDVPADTSGWDYNRKIYIAPMVGVRLFVTRDIFIRAEARSLFAKVRYPESYREEPAKQPGTNANPNAVLAGQRVQQWVGSGLYTFGIGIPFPWP
jgi:hypothetical protein